MGWAGQGSAGGKGKCEEPLRTPGHPPYASAMTNHPEPYGAWREPAVDPESQTSVTEHGRVAMRDWLKLSFVAALTLLVLTTAARIAAAIITRGEIDAISEVWLALSMDAAHDVLYRPLIDASGYGGTRYFPLQIVLQGALVRATDDVIVSGYIVTMLALCTLLGAAYLALRCLGTSRAAAAGFSALLLSSAAVQMAAVATRGDILPAALALVGFVACERASRVARPWLAALAGFLFGLAFLTKLSAVAGIVAGTVVLVLTRGWLFAAWVPTVFLATTTVGLAAFQYASDGRFFLVLAACASGDTGFLWALLSPYKLVRNVWGLTSVSSPFAVLAAMALPMMSIGSRFRPWSIYLASVLATTLAIHADRSAASNHLLDLEVAAALWLADGWVTKRLSSPLAMGAATVVAFIASFNLLTAPGWGLLRRPDSHLGADYSAAAELAVSKGAPILSIAPLVPVLARQRPFLLDPWMFHHLEVTKGGFAEDLQRRIATGEFSAVVLHAPPSPLADIDAWLGPRTLETVKEAYPIVQHVGILDVRFRRPPDPQLPRSALPQ